MLNFHNCITFYETNIKLKNDKFKQFYFFFGLIGLGKYLMETLFLIKFILKTTIYIYIMNVSLTAT